MTDTDIEYRRAPTSSWKPLPALVAQSNAADIPLADGSVDLVIFSPPYYGLRLYVDGGIAYHGQVGNEPTPEEFLRSLWIVMREVWRVLAPWGNAWVNLGDKRTGSGSHNNATLGATRGSARDLPRIGEGYASGEAHADRGREKPPAADGRWLGEPGRRRGFAANDHTSANGQPRKYAGREVTRGGIDPTEAARPGSRQQRMAAAIDGRRPPQGGLLAGRARNSALETVNVGRRQTPERYTQAAFGRNKTKMLLPHRFAQGCIDGFADPCVRQFEDPGHVCSERGFWTPGLNEWEQCRGIGWLVRQDEVWQKANGIPESVPDRPHDNHEYWFLLAKSEDSYYGTERIREEYAPDTAGKYAAVPDGGYTNQHDRSVRLGTNGDLNYNAKYETNPLGKMPGSVRKVGTEPFKKPGYLVTDDRGWRFLGYEATWQYARMRWDEGHRGPIMVRELSHYAAFPTTWPEWCIKGWAPLDGVCTACGVPRRRRTGRPCEECGELVPTQAKSCPACGHRRDWKAGRETSIEHGATDWSTPGAGVPRLPGGFENRTLLDAPACACPDTSAPTREARVLDCFGGTGTTALVARALGAVGFSFDLSNDYSRLATWRIFHSDVSAKVRTRQAKKAQAALF